MYQILTLLEARLQDLERERMQMAQASIVPSSGLGQSLRQSAGDALISLGTRIKPRSHGSHLKLSSTRLAGH